MATLVVFICIYGFFSSSVSALTPSVIGQITPDDKLGARIGAFYSVISIASLVGPPIGGALITSSDDKDGYRWLIVFSVGVRAIHMNER
jgi:MCP family monocarboxylic acid transporter-like MFS transporter 10